MMQEMQRLVGHYQSWLNDEIKLREVEDYIEITTPFLDRHNDYMQIYAKRNGDGYLLSDLGYTLDDLEMSGCPLDSPRRKALLAETVLGFGVENVNNNLQAHANESDFPLRKHSLIQAMLAVNDLFYLARPHVENFFLDDVTAWLNSSEVRFIPKVKFAGVSGYDHIFDFAIPKSPTAPERLIKAINNPQRQAVQTLAFSWHDTREARNEGSKAYAVLNDSERSVSSTISIAFKKCEVIPMSWTARSEFLAELAA